MNEDTGKGALPPMRTEPPRRCEPRLHAALATVALLAGCAAAPLEAPAPIEIPVELRSGLPTTTVSVAGVPLRLFLDLGGYNAIALTTSELTRAVVSFFEDSVRSMQASGAIFESRRFLAQDVSLGGVAVGPLEGSEFTFLDTAAPPDRNGYVGFGLLGRFLVVLDYPGRWVRLYPSGASAELERECGTQRFPVDVVNGVPQSTVDTAGGKLVFSWDTGSSRNVLLPSVPSRSTPSRHQGSNESYRIDSFVLGGRDLGPQDFLLIDYRGLATDGVLGTDFFARNVVCLDFGRGVGAIRP